METISDPIGQSTRNLQSFWKKSVIITIDNRMPRGTPGNKKPLSHRDRGSSTQLTFLSSYRTFGSLPAPLASYLSEIKKIGG
jgi:hypothetical protein